MILPIRDTWTGLSSARLISEPFFNDFKVAAFGREEAIRRFSHKLFRTISLEIVYGPSPACDLFATANSVNPAMGT